MFSELTEGVESYRIAIGMLSKYKLWKYVVLPGMISVALAVGLIFATMGILEYLGELDYTPGWLDRGLDGVGGWLSGISWLEKPIMWLSRISGGFAKVLSVLISTGVLLFLFKYIIMVVIAPFMGMLSEKIESIQTGNPPPKTTVKQFILDIVRGLRIALRNIIRELFYTLVFMLFSGVIPLIGSIISTIAIFWIQAYYAGFGNMDYTLERRRFSVRDSVRFVGTHRGLAVGNGAVFLLIFLIPVIGWFLAPAYGTIAATLTSLKRLQLET
ncbi:MAG: EI24 domain-containing protein [Bacteroidota bacterium]